MALKILLNIFYNIAIILLVGSAIWSFNHASYGLLLGALFSLVLVVFLKIRLVKQVKELTRK